MLSVNCPGRYEQLFDRQVERLIECGYPEALGMTEKDFRLWLAMLTDPPTGLFARVNEVIPGHIPFLIVVPHAMLTIELQMKLLVVAKKRGFASLDCAKLWNPEGVGESKFPYLISGVADGTQNVGRVTGEVAGEIKRDCRQGLVFEEGIALAVHSPEALVHHAFAMIDNHYQGASLGRSSPNSSPQCVPELWLSSGGPTQSYSWLGSRREDRGVPSCRRRLFLGGQR